MDENRVEGTARRVSGKIQEEVGRVTGDAKTRAEGVFNEAGGAAQDLFGQGADGVRQTSKTLDALVRETIETQPYTAALVALGLGWLLGRLHRPF